MDKDLQEDFNRRINQLEQDFNDLRESMNKSLAKAWNWDNRLIVLEDSLKKILERTNYLSPKVEKLMCHVHVKNGQPPVISVDHIF